MLTYIYLNVDECLLCPSKCLNSKFLSIMLILNKLCFLEVLLMAMLALTWSGCISLCSYHNIIYINNDRHSPVCKTR